MPAGARAEVRRQGTELKVGTPGAFGNFYARIEGYSHEPGIRNVLRLKRYAVPNPPADGSAVAYVLDMVVQTETVQP